jgi:hypothetical protein
LAGKLSQGPAVKYYNRNVAHNGDIIANTNENPMVENQDFKESKKKTFVPPVTRRLIRDQPSPTELTMNNFAKLNLTENKYSSIDQGQKFEAPAGRRPRNKRQSFGDVIKDDSVQKGALSLI